MSEPIAPTRQSMGEEGGPDESRRPDAPNGGGRGGAAQRDRHGWRQEGTDLLRAIAAGSIVGMPLLYTMEMWWHGMTASPGHLLVLLGVTLVANAVFCFFSGFRAEWDVVSAVSESVSSVGMGLAYSAAVLVLVRAIDFGAAWTEALGKVLAATAPVSLGISFANSQVRGKSRSGGDDQSDGQGRGDGHGGSDHPGPRPDPNRLQLRQDLTEIAVTFSGALIFSYNMAPTEEVVLIATRLTAWHLLALVAVSLLLCHTILFAAGFKERRVYVHSLFQHPWVETIMAYAVALIVSCLLLYLVGFQGATSHPATAARCVVTLALPAVVGGSAGRLIT